MADDLLGPLLASVQAARARMNERAESGMSGKGQTVRGRRWQELLTIVGGLGVAWEREGSYGVRIAHSDGFGAGHLLLRVSTSARSDVRARSIGPWTDPLDSPATLWAESVTLVEVPAVVREYVATGGQR